MKYATLLVLIGSLVAISMIGPSQRELVRAAEPADSPVIAESARAVAGTPTSIAGRENQVLADLKYLAADAREGRDTGTPGIEQAAQYIEQEFKRQGLTTPQDLPSGRQQFTIPGLPELGDDSSLAIQLGERNLKLTLDEQYTVCSFGGAGEFEAPIVFCGYGISDAENGFDEFANVDLKGKVALILRRVPGQTKPGSRYVDKRGKMDTNRAALRAKLTNAQKQGAVAVLFVNDLFATADSEDTLMKFGYGGGGDGKRVPIFHIKQSVAAELIEAGTGQSLKSWHESMEEKLVPASVELKNVSASGQADLEYAQTQGFNVIGVLEPQNPETAETVIVGAHYDHVGMGKYGSLAPGTLAIHNGADDNASGTAALMALARKLNGLNGQLQRRIVLICFSAEERGLLGSKHYVANPIYPLDQTIAMINLDMVGRMADEKLTVFGVGSSSFWNPWLDEWEKSSSFNYFREPKAFGPSDHASFYEKQIPVLHLFTGLHEDYHRPTDDIDEINLAGIVHVVDLLHALALELAETSDRPEYIENKQWIQVGRHAGGRPFVGISPDPSFTGDGYRIGMVTQNSPAALAGLKSGHTIIGVSGQEVKTRDDFWRVVDAAKPKSVLEIQFNDDAGESTTELKLGPPR